MPLIYGFPKQSEVKAEDYWQKYYQTLSEEQQTFFHSTLPFAMINWGVSHISPGTIDDIVQREHTNICPIFPKPKNTTDEEWEQEIIKVLTPFFGFEANVSMQTFNNWIKTKVQHEARRSKLKTQRNVDNEYREYRKWRLATQIEKV